MRRAILVILLTTFTASARAEAPADAADTYFRQGNGLYKEQRWADARAAYESAWRLEKSHDIAANLGYAEMKLGRFRDAAEHLAFAVKNWPPTGKADKREYAVERLVLAKQQVGALTIRVDTERADVFVDGAIVGASPLEDDVFVEPGSHTVEAKRAGREDAKQVVTVAKGGAQTVALALPPVPPSPPPPPPMPSAQPPPVAPVTAPGPNRAIVVSGAVIGGVGLVVGAGLAIGSAIKGSNADSALTALQRTGQGKVCPTQMAACSAIDSDRRAHDALGKGALGAFVTGGALGLATLGYALAARGPKATGVRLVPTVGVRNAGVVLAGEW